MPSKLAVDLELELRPPNPDPAQEFKEALVFSSEPGTHTPQHVG